VFRSWPHSSFFAFTDGARTPPEELVNPASAKLLAKFLRGAASTSLTLPFPSRLGLSWDCRRFSFVHHRLSRSFNELGRPYQIPEPCELNLVHRLIHFLKELLAVAKVKKALENKGF
jgi:hypothetical protein